MSELTYDQLIVGNQYKWKGQTEILEYSGKDGCWNQFSKVSDGTGEVWCEVVDHDLHMLESVQ